MITISLCMIVKNEEDVLHRCLSSVADLVDEIIIVDTGSTDKTIEIAKQFTPHVVSFPWIDDFAAARNYAFSFSQMDYAMWLDADDVLLEKDRQAFLELRETLSPTVNVVMMPYHTGVDEMGNVTFSYYRERIIKNGVGMKWTGAVHEVIEPVGEIFYASSAVTHHKLHPSDPMRNLRIFQQQIAKGETLDPRQQFYYGRELYYHKRYQDALTVLEGFLENQGGWVENQIDACCHCAYCYYGLEKPSQAVLSLFRSFSFDLPRAEVCCDIGKHFIDRQQYSLAAFWYTIATTAKRSDTNGGFASPDCYGYIPCIQLCVCYSQMGELDRAIRFNELAATFKPDAPAVLHNRAYFQKLASQE